MMQIPLTLPRPLRQDGDMQHSSIRTLLADAGHNAGLHLWSDTQVDSRH